MATDDERPPARSGSAGPRSTAAGSAEPIDDHELAERLTERIRSGNTQPPPNGQERGLDRDSDGLTQAIRQRLEHLVPELVKKTFAAGMGAVFQTEEGIRKLARENLPDVAGYIASSTGDAKDKVWEVIARETRAFLANLNLTEEIAKLLTTLSFEIKTEVRFIPNSERLIGSEPDVKASVRLKRTSDKADKESGSK